MKIRIFVLGTDSAGADPLFEKILRNTFDGFLPENGAIEYYASVKDATASIGSAFPDAQAVLFFAAPDSYCSIKKIIARAFRFNMDIQEKILEKANRFAPDKMKSDEQFAETHALLPVSAKAFVSSDGLFSGFGSVRGGQSVIFLPYQTDRASALLSAQVIPFINAAYEQSIPTAYSEHIYAQRLHETLEKEPVRIAMALTKTADLFCDYISSSAVLSENITKTPRSEERGTMRPSEYVVNLSIAAAELQGVPYGIVLSNAYYMDDTSKERLTVFMAVTNAARTTVRELKSFAWESSSEFMQRCCGELCCLLNEIIEKDRGIGAEGTDDDPKKVHKYRSLAAITGAAIILLIIFGSYIFTSNSYSLKDWMHNHFPAIFSQSVSVDTAKPSAETKAADTPENTSAAENTSVAAEIVSASAQMTETNTTGQSPVLG